MIYVYNRSIARTPGNWLVFLPPRNPSGGPWEGAKGLTWDSNTDFESRIPGPTQAGGVAAAGSTMATGAGWPGQPSIWRNVPHHDFIPALCILGPHGRVLHFHRGRRFRDHGGTRG